MGCGGGGGVISDISDVCLGVVGDPTLFFIPFIGCHLNQVLQLIDGSHLVHRQCGIHIWSDMVHIWSSMVHTWYTGSVGYTPGTQVVYCRIHTWYTGSEVYTPGTKAV